MKPSFTTLLICAGLIGAQAEDTPQGMLTFTNGDRLSGSPGRISNDGHLIWSADALLEGPVRVRLDRVLELRLDGQGAEKDAEGHRALLSLTNGDTIRGQLSGLDEDYVTLDTPYGGRLKIRRSMASSLEIVRSEKALYSGPDSIENWTSSGENGAWGFHNGQLLARKGGGVARKIPMPEQAHLSFDLAWRNTLKFRLLLFSDTPESSQPDNCYDLVCQRRFVYMRKRWMTPRSGGSRIIGQSANIRELAESENVRVDFYIDRKAGNIAFYVDGRQAQVWADQDPGDGNFGDWLHFISEDSYPLRISRLRVAPWNGNLPENADLEPDEVSPDEEGQQLRLQNGDVVIGKVGDIQDGVLAIKTKHAEISIPVERMRTVNLAGGDYEEPKRMKGDIRGWLREGERLTFRLDAFRDGELVGYSQTFGEATFRADAFSRLEFNIYAEDLESLRADPEW